MCRVLDGDNGETSGNASCSEPHLIGQHCNIKCEEVLGKNHINCQSHKICLQNHKCFCAWGYQGEFCNQTCSQGHWGFNCSSKCHLGCKSCDIIQGCKECKENYFGEGCSEKFPVVQRAAVVTAISENSVKLIQNMEYGENETRPEFYLIQYKKNGEDMFNNYTKEAYTLENKTFKIQDVLFSEHVYKIRTIFIIKNQSFGNKVPETTVNAVSLNASFGNNETIKVMWSNLKMDFDDYLIRYECTNNFCSNSTKIEKGHLPKTVTNMTIKNINSFTLCKINLSGMINETYQLIGQINLRPPNSTVEIEDREMPQHVTISENKLVMDLGTCETFSGPLRYNITYKCINKWCNNDSPKWENFSLDRYQANVNIQLTKLRPFSNYSINITATRFDQVDKVKSIIDLTPSGQPSAVEDFSVYCKNDSAVWIRWREPYPPTGTIQSYNITYKHDEQQHYLTSFTPCKLWPNFKCSKITLLKNETMYNLTIQAKNYNVTEWSEPKALSIETTKNEFLDLTQENSTFPAIKASETELPQNIMLEGSKFRMEFQTCEIGSGPLNYSVSFRCISEWCDKETIRTENISLNSYQNVSEQDIQKLRPFSNYMVNITVSGQNINKKQKEYSILKTPPSKPCRIQNFSVYCKDDNTLWLRWKDPYPPTGILEYYSITYNDKAMSNFSSSTTCELWDGHHCTNITELKKDTSYNLSIQVKNRNVPDLGEPITITALTKQEESEAPGNLSIESSTATKVMLTWVHPFNMNGPINSFYIQTNSGNTEELPIKAYHRNYQHAITVERGRQYNISVWGVNKFEGNKSKLNLTVLQPIPEFSPNLLVEWCSENCYLMLPLPSDISFNVTVVGKQSNKNRTLYSSSQKKSSRSMYTTENSNVVLLEIGKGLEQAVSIKNDTHRLSLTFDNKEYPMKYKSEEELTKGYGIYIAVTTIILIIIIIIAVSLAGYLCYARKNEKFPCRKKNKANIDEPHELEALHSLTTSTEIKIKRNEFDSKPIKIEDFENYVITSLEDDPEDNEITQQFEAVSKTIPKERTCGQLPDNADKNRYKNIIAYDDTRVILEDSIEGDYINANYVDGYKTPRAFIATQAPLPSTVHDFWLMVCQENVSTVVMLTELRENGRIKCEQYWPDFQSKYRFGQVLIENVSTKIFPNYFHRELQVIYKEKTHFVQHFQYVTWPDHGIPLDTQAFVAFIQEIKKLPKHTPVVVHCNAGCGRTGSYILCDIILRMATKEKQVDFVKVLWQMRNQRPYLVHNVDQYIFVHFAVLEHFFRKDFTIPITNNFQAEVRKAVDKASLEILLEYLDKAIKQHERTKFKLNVQLTDEEKAKNRFNTILPGYSQIFLPVSSQDSSNYINAVCVDCYRFPKKFVVTQQPLPNTLVDFWKLIQEYEIDTIVSLNEIVDNDPKCPKFWPSATNETILLNNSSKVTFLKQNRDDSCDIIRVKLNNSMSKKTVVHVIDAKNWKRGQLTPPSIENLITVWKKIVTCNGKVVVTCYDGATASGLFVALASLLEKINMDHTCDVFSAVKLVKESRYQFIQDSEQLEFLYRTAVEYIREFSTYGNFNS